MSFSCFTSVQLQTHIHTLFFPMVLKIQILHNKNRCTNTFSFRKWKRQFKFLGFEEVLSRSFRMSITINRKIFPPALPTYNFSFASKTCIVDQVNMVISWCSYLTMAKYCLINQTGQYIFLSIQTGMSDDSQMIVWRQSSKFVCSGFWLDCGQMCSIESSGCECQSHKVAWLYMPYSS